ncbi:hypothetical protein ACH79_30990 [Bradyrhizobium sp. CCBAU 051011]|uniref:hypothetical protein n=1 Tax=Bradyrhizobium sp. CCBAU 051011 TaxID=858422 RepID=UPI0013738DA5|nr:hypothetical protein [Bradyrhizobium sp. CCBAU 051011]QHO76386.1 hypothetical protein ACH79_30990 [Bradyrhizobium sp. CCBAU 051011]
MQDAARHSIWTVLLALSITLAFGSGLAQAQSGSAGGSIGNDEKSLSGSREPPRATESEKPARRSKPEVDEPRRASQGSGGGVGSFDGAWVVNSVGTTCSGSSRNAVVVSSGRIIGQGVSGRVSPNGAVSAINNSSGVTATSVGRLSGRSGSGTFRQSDGCSGRWTASKQ